jgi:hypothetical protein
VARLSSLEVRGVCADNTCNAPGGVHAPRSRACILGEHTIRGDEVTAKAPLDLQGIADKLGVRYYRVRRWRKNALNNNHNPQARRLCSPDVSDLERAPLWSDGVIEEWAKFEGLWPPGVDQYVCGYCGGTYSVYAYDNPVLRPHNWQPHDDGKLWPCEGSYQPPKGKAPSTYSGRAVPVDA